MYLSQGVAVCSGVLSVPGDSCSVFIHLAFSISSGKKKNKGPAKRMDAYKAFWPNFDKS